MLGHVGYTVVPWKRRQGYASRGLGLILPELELLGLPYVELVTDADNRASQKVIEANGGVLIERFTQLAAHGGGEGTRYRIPVGPDGSVQAPIE